MKITIVRMSWKQWAASVALSPLVFIVNMMVLNAITRKPRVDPELLSRVLDEDIAELECEQLERSAYGW